MSTYTIQIDDEALRDQINTILNQIIGRELYDRCSDAREAIALAIKDMIYSRKDEIIDKIIDKATTEIVRKGLPRLLERMTKDEVVEEGS